MQKSSPQSVHIAGIQSDVFQHLKGIFFTFIRINFPIFMDKF